jgi:hypothetical protein
LVRLLANTQRKIDAILKMQHPTLLKQLCYFRSMLLGAELHNFTDHKNILNVGDSSERCLGWILYVDEYSPTLHYIEGPHNMIAETFSRLPRQDDTSALVGKKAITEDSELAGYSLFEDKKISDSLVILPCLNSHKKRKQLKARTLVTQ